MKTAITMIEPMTTGCRYAETFIRVRPFVITPINVAPINVPITPPMPPKRLVPPMTTAAIAVNSVPVAVVGSPLLKRDVSKSPPIPQHSPEIAYVALVIDLTAKPESRAASGLAANRVDVASQARITQHRVRGHRHGKKDDDRKRNRPDESLAEERENGAEAVRR
jgi:hypothetical protein